MRAFASRWQSPWARDKRSLRGWIPCSPWHELAAAAGQAHSELRKRVWKTARAGTAAGGSSMRGIGFAWAFLVALTGPASGDFTLDDSGSALRVLESGKPVLVRSRT